MVQAGNGLRPDGRQAHVRLLSANHLKERKQLDQRTYQRHRYRGASSNLFYASVLDDDSASVFSGMILVEEERTTPAPTRATAT